MTTCGCIHYPLETCRYNPASDRLIMMCKMHAKLHDEGHTFTVYTTEDNQ